ncbi:MAG: DUF4860 domain-containing protein [Lachnospirales bacterium]
MIKNKRKGSSNMETIFTMVLLIMFGGAVFTLIYAGSLTQKEIMSEKDVKVNARVASSYIDVQLKKYDAENSIFIEVNPNTNENALVFRDDPNEYFDEELYTWIFFEDGVLYTQSITKDQELISGLGVEIAKVDGFTVTLNDNKVTSIIDYTEGESKKSIKNVTVIRSLN